MNDINQLLEGFRTLSPLHETSDFESGNTSVLNRVIRQHLSQVTRVMVILGSN